LSELADLNKLKEMSDARQGTLSEFMYLKKSISRSKTNRETKTFSLNLANRLAQKNIDLEATKALSKFYESLSEKAFPLSEVKLQVVIDQTLKSLQARGENLSPTSEKESAISFEKPKNLDIRLHESVRIMVDWIEILDDGEVSQKSSTKPKPSTPL
jgi:hypothetical protein